MKKLHKLLLSFSIVLLVSVFVQPNNCVAENAVHFNLIDLMPDFFSYCSEATALNSAERVQLFKKELIEPHQIVFDAALQSSMGKPKDASVAKYLSIVQERLPSIRTTSGEFSNAFSQSCESFEKYFPI